MDPFRAALAAVVGGGLVSAVWALVNSWLLERSLRQERHRLAAVVEVDSSDDPVLWRYGSGLHGDNPAEATEDDENGGLVVRPADPAGRFAPLLIECYAYGLAQAKRHSAASLTMSRLGGLLILAGLGVLIYDAQMDRNIAAPSVATAAGVLTYAIAALFHRQADEVLRNLHEQTQTVRADLRQERAGRQAVDQLDRIDDPALRDRLRAALVLRLSGASLTGLAPAATPAPAHSVAVDARTAPIQPVVVDPVAALAGLLQPVPGRRPWPGPGGPATSERPAGADPDWDPDPSPDSDSSAAVPLRSRRGRKPGPVTPPLPPNATDPGAP